MYFSNIQTYRNLQPNVCFVNWFIVFAALQLEEPRSLAVTCRTRRWQNDTAVRTTQTPVDFAVSVVADSLSVDSKTAILPQVFSPPGLFIGILMHNWPTVKDCPTKLWIIEGLFVQNRMVYGIHHNFHSIKWFIQSQHNINI